MRLTWDILIVVAMATSLTIYFRGFRRARIRWWEATAFATGWAVIACALLGPVDTLSDVLFSVHMTQHELLMLIAAPLIVAGRPLIAGMWGLPSRARDTAIAATRPIVTPWRALTNPMVVLILHAVVLWSWHIPRAFEWALHNESVHAVQHLMFFVTAALFWWSLIHGRFGRVGYGVAVFFVFITAMHTGILGVLITFAKTVWYPTYAHTTPHALEDQQLAGLIMWIPAGVIFIIVALALFAAWIGESERRVRSSALLLLLVPFLFIRCSDYPGDRIAEAKQITGGGEPDRGKTAIRQYGCGTCHTIPGVPGATATVGPPLDKMAMRGYLAGRLPNTPRNLMMWIRRPRSVDPKTAMPDMGVTERDGRDIAAYLLTLK
jgi:cytochrome c oxidase assembly factor CtaG/cytochrome c2